MGLRVGGKIAKFLVTVFTRDLFAVTNLLVWLYWPSVTKRDSICSAVLTMKYIMPLKISRTEVSTLLNPTQWMTQLMSTSVSVCLPVRQTVMTSANKNTVEQGVVRRNRSVIPLSHRATQPSLPGIHNKVSRRLGRTIFGGTYRLRSREVDRIAWRVARASIRWNPSIDWPVSWHCGGLLWCRNVTDVAASSSVGKVGRTAPVLCP